MGDLKEIAEVVKATVTMYDVCERLNIRVPASKKIPSIYKAEKTPSLHLYRDGFYDYATGQGGDIIRFVMDYNGWSFPRTVRWLSSGNAFVSQSRRRQEAPEQEDVDLSDEWEHLHSRFSGADSVLWGDRAWAKWHIPLAWILLHSETVVVDGKMYTAHRHDGKVRGVKVRFPNGAKTSLPGSSYRYGLYRPLDPGPPSGGPAWLVEGESDTWAMARVGLYNDVFGLPGGAGMWRDQWRNAFEGYSHLVVVTDVDDAGETAADRIVGSVKSGFPNMYVTRAYPPLARVAESIAAAHDPWSWPTVLR